MRHHRSFRPLLMRVVVLLLLTTSALLYGWPQRALAAEPSFAERRPFGGAPGYVWSVATGDLDGDGSLDIATALASGYGVVYLNDGQGHFTDTRLFGLGSDNIGVDQITVVAIGDMNGDGNLDLVTNRGAYLNDGAGNFTTLRALIGLGSDGIINVALGDLNGDGALDVAAGSEYGQSAVYLNDGAGNFIAPFTVGAGAYGVSRVAVGDLNGDGYLDLVEGHQQAQSALYVNDGFGNFNTGRPFAPETAGVSQVAVGDLNGDGFLDIVAGRSKQQSTVYLNDGAGNFTAYAFGPVAAEITYVALGDMDGDDHLDIVVGRPLGQSALYLNDGAGHFPTAHTFATGTQTTTSLALSDMNGDGALDISASVYAGQSAVYLNDGVGAFKTARTFAPDTHDITSVAVGDMDGDGHLDVVMVRKIGQGVVYLNDSRGNILTARPFGQDHRQAAVARPEESIAVGDLNGDQHLDIVMVNQDGQGTLWLNDGAGNFTQSHSFGPTTPNEHPDNRFEATVVVGDLNGDGPLDLVVGIWGGPNVVYLNDGAGNFSAARPFGTGLRNTLGMALGDLNGDGALDLAVAIQVGQSVVYLNDGTGNFTGVRPIGTGAYNTAAVAVGDLNGDGHLDIVMGRQGDTNVVYLNDGVGNFLTARPFGPNSDLANGVAVGDLNGDGHLDIIVGSSGQSAVYLNDGAGDFTSTRFFDADNTPNLSAYWLHSYIALGDIDSDGSLDLIVGHDLVDPSDVTDHNPLAKLQEQQKISEPPQNNVYLNRQAARRIKVNQPGRTPSANFQATTAILSARVIPITYTLASGDSAPIGRIAAFYSLDGGGQWRPAIVTTSTLTANVATSPTGIAHRFDWDTYASGFFGQSDAVVLRFIAYPQARQPTNAGLFRYVNAVAGPYQQPYISTVTFPFRARGMQIRVVNAEDEPVAGALVYRLPPEQFTGALAIADSTGQPFRTSASGYLQGRGELHIGDQLVALLPMTATHLVTFTNQFAYYLTSAAPITAGLAMHKISSPGLITITLPTAPAQAHPLLLFNLTVSLEWDASADPTFLATLTEDFKRASELLYHATDGQVALGRIDVFPAKTFWNRADIVIYAGNSLRPTATIGGIVNATLGEMVRPALDQPATKAVAVAYVPGQVRMGTTWDPFGEEAGDLSEQWWRALAHELAHHLFFLPDDYLGFKLNNPAQPNGQRTLGRVDCQGSFMTSTFDPNYRKFLNRAQWLGDCRQTLAEQTTARSDWATITHFYPMLEAPHVRPLAGPDILPLAVTQVVLWPVTTPHSTLAARYFDLRSDTGAVIRLPTAHVYLFQTQGTADPGDDGLLALGSPTGGGDRIKVRGAQLGDRLCLVDFGASDGKSYSGCIPQVSAASGSIPVRALDPGQSGARWAPAIAIQAITTRTLVVTVTQALSTNHALKVQVFPAHYASAPGLAPVAELTMTKGVYVGQIQLPYPASDVTVRVWVADGSNREAISQFNLQLPWQASDRVMAGPNSAMLGGPNSAMLGGPNSAMLGGPNSAMLGGPNSAMLGGSDYPMIGGTPHYQFTAPALSADSQVIIYNPDGIFEPNGIASLQILPSPPEISDESWLVPVGQAYAVEPEATLTTTLTIAVTYLQRDVPAGYEQTLALYYLPKGGSTWQRLPTFQFVENLVAANLQPAAGIYAVMATVALPELQPGRNLFTYPLLDSRPITTALASLYGRYTDLYEVDANGRRLSAPTMLVFGHVYSINLKGEQPAILYLAPPRRSPDGSVAGSQ